VDSVAKNATTLVNTIVETDWQKELADIQQGLKEDTQQIEETVERRLGWQRADGASTSEGGSNAREASSGSPPGAHGGLGFSLAALGQSFVTGTTELFEQVRVCRFSILAMSLCRPWCACAKVCPVSAPVVASQVQLHCVRLL
jgi:hypothetical protein